MEIQGPDNDTTTTSGDGVRIASANSFWVRPAFQNVDVNHFGGGAGYRLGSAAFAGPENGSFINCSASFCDVGFSFNNAANAHTLVHVGVQYCHSRGIEILDSVTTSVYGGLIQSNDKTGIYIGGIAGQGAEQILLSSIYFENNNTTSTAGMYAVHVLGSTAGGACAYITFENVRFAGARDTVWLDATGVASTAGVSFIGCRQNAGPAITINSAAVYNTVLFQSGAPLTDNGTGTNVISDNSTGNTTLARLSGNLTVAIPANLTVANGANNNLALPSVGVVYPIIGPSAIANITGIAGGTNGRIIMLVNTQEWNVTLNYNNAGSSTWNRFLLPAGADVVLTPYSSVILYYATNVWYVVGRNN
jgi:hypothetical protein